MEYLKKKFTIDMGASEKYQENWDLIFHPCGFMFPPCGHRPRDLSDDCPGFDDCPKLKERDDEKDKC